MPIDLKKLTAGMARDRTKVANLLDNVKFPTARAKQTNVWGYVLESEIRAGSMFLCTVPDNTLYFVSGLTAERLVITGRGGNGKKFRAYLNSRYGISEHTPSGVFKYVLSEMQDYATRHGARVEMRRFATYRTTEGTETVYMSNYNGMMWRIDGEDVKPIQNGEDDVFFIDDDGGIETAVQVEDNGVLFDRLINQINYADTGVGGMTSEQMRLAFIVWMFALAFPDLMPTKPLLILEGAQGSGKSASLQLLQYALLGESNPIILSRNKEDDFGVLLLRSPICMFDNLDAYIDWIPDAVAGYTTTGKWKRRRLFTDAEELILKPHAFIAVASKNPASFRREDVADRCIILRLERRERFVRFQALEQEIKTLRPQILGEYLYYVNKIVAEIRQGALKQAVDEEHRMADFAAFARIVSRVLEWGERAVDDLLSAIRNEQYAFISEADPLPDLLREWVGRRPKNGPSNVGREIGLQPLHFELEWIAQAKGMKFYGAQTLAQKLRSPHIERDFTVMMISADGDKTYKIWRKSDPQLTLVPSEVVSRDDDDIDEAVIIKAVDEE